MTALLGVLLAAELAGPAIAQKSAKGSMMIPGGKSHEPVNINADKLEYFDKDQKAVYSGNVAVTQGEATMKCSALTIFMAKGEKSAASGGEPTALAGNSDVSRMEAAGPVSIVQKDQTGSGDSGLYERAENRLTLSGHAKLKQGSNTTTGDRIVYSIVEGRAVVEGNVKSFFVPGSAPAAGGDEGDAKKKPKP